MPLYSMERQYIILSKGTRESCQREPSRQLAEGGARRALGRDGNRAQGTPEQNKAVVQGSIAFYGTYTVNEADKTLIRKYEIALIPNNDGNELKASVMAVVMTADRYDDQITSKWGGQRAVDRR